MKPLIFVLLALVAANASAQSADGDDSPPQLSMVVGNGDDVSAFDGSGSGWWALACDAQGCALEPARAEAKAMPPSSDDTSYAPKVKLERLHPDTRTVLAWLQPPSGWPIAWLQPGPVRTYGLGPDGFQRPHTAGTYELSVRRDGKELARFVPMIDPKAREYVLQLRTRDERQVFDHVLWQCAGSGGTNYLMWAGDLDRDGQPDYLVNFLDEDSDNPLAGRGYIVLYLSSYAGTSRAGDDDLAGMAAEYQVDDRTDCPGVPASVFSHLTPVADTPAPASAPQPAPGTHP